MNGIVASLDKKMIAHLALRMLVERFSNDHFFAGEYGKNTLFVGYTFTSISEFFLEEMNRAINELTLSIRESGRDKIVEMPIPDRAWVERVTDRSSNISLIIFETIADGIRTCTIQVGLN